MIQISAIESKLQNKYRDAKGQACKQENYGFGLVCDKGQPIHAEPTINGRLQKTAPEGRDHQP